jgi:hypothetical protein
MPEGRPLKMTPAARQKIVSALKAGMTRSGAAGIAGVHVCQIGRWCEKDATFASECAIAEQEAEARMTGTIVKAAANGDWKAAESWLKRRRPEEWGDRLTLLKAAAETVKNADESDLLALLGYEPAGTGDPSPVGAGGAGEAGEAAGAED